MNELCDDSFHGLSIYLQEYLGFFSFYFWKGLGTEERILGMQVCVYCKNLLPALKTLL